MIQRQPEHVYLKYFSRSMTTTLRVLLGLLLCWSCTQDVSVGPQPPLPYLSFCIRPYMGCYNEHVNYKITTFTTRKQLPPEAEQRTAGSLNFHQVNVFGDAMIDQFSAFLQGWTSTVKSPPLAHIKGAARWFNSEPEVAVSENTFCLQC